MRKRIRKAISTILAAVMMFTAVPALSMPEGLGAYGEAKEESLLKASPAPDRVAEAIEKFAYAASKFAEDTSELSELSAFLTRFGGVTSAAAGAVGILQMAGIIKDPTKEALGEIIDDLHDIQDQLKQMDNKLTVLRQELVAIAVAQEEKDRNNKTLTMLTNWSDFNTHYCEPLDKMIKEYQGKIDVGIEGWWKNSPKEGVRVLYTLSEEGEPLLTYSRNSYEEGFPETADNGEKVAQDHSFGVPGELIPDTSKLTFNINTYRDVFIEKMAQAFVTAADEKKLDAADAFYTSWNGSSAEEKQSKAMAYSSDILNTEIYHIACRLMHEDHIWVIDAAEAYLNYCKHAMDTNSGVNAMLNAMYLTHGFEGEIKDEIEDFCEAMVVRTGVYGQFALTCACQDDMMRLEDRQKLQQQFTDAVISMSDKKKYAVTGFDNFCYVTGTKVLFDQVTASCKYGYKSLEYSYKGDFRKTNWVVTAPNMMNNVYSQVLYHQYQTLHDGCGSFVEYLDKYNTGIPKDYQGLIMTNFGGTVDFALNEGIPMKCRQVLGDYFSDAATYNINKGNSSKVENKYFRIHDKLIYDVMDMKDESLRVDQTAAARAFYGESHWYWLTDEIHLFNTPNTRQTHGIEGEDYYEVYNYLDLDILRLQLAKDINGEGSALEDPFFAFDSPVLTEGVSDVIGPVIIDSKTPITDVLLKQETYKYSGKAIRPQVTVKAGTDTVPADSYSVSYLNNKASGVASVIVEGKGKYSGMINKCFTIVPKGTSISKVSKKGKTAVIKWKKQAGKMSSSRITGYQIRYSTKSSMKGAKTVKVKGYKKLSKKISGLKKNKKYYFQIRTYMNTEEKICYSSWSTRKAAK